MSRRAAALALAAVASPGCRRTPEVTEPQMLRILEDPKAMPPVRPELAVGERQAGCSYFWRTNGRVGFGKPACDELRQGMAIYTLRDGAWTLKTAVFEKLAVKPFTCPPF